MEEIKVVLPSVFNSIRGQWQTQDGKFTDMKTYVKYVKTITELSDKEQNALLKEYRKLKDLHEHLKTLVT
jgi:hypothetical protein